MSNQFNLKTSDNLSLQTENYSVDQPKAIVLLIHGFSEYYGRYPHVAEFFNQNDFVFWAFDRRGHGHSEGLRGHMPSLDSELDDIQMQLDKAKETYPNVPVFLYGHSQGGNLGLNFILRRNPDIKGAIITSPWIELVEKPSKTLVTVARFLQRFFPKIQDKAGVASLSRDPEIDKKYAIDPLIHLKISIRAANEMLLAAEWLAAYNKPIDTPILLMHGTGDKVIEWKPSKDFFENTGKSIDFELWEGWYHELHNEPEKEKVFNYMKDWLNGQLKRG